MKNGSSPLIELFKSIYVSGRWPNNRPTGHNAKIDLFPYRPQTSVKRRDPVDSTSMGAFPIPAN